MTAWKEAGDIVPGASIGSFRLGVYGHELLPENSESSIGEYSIRFNVRVGLEAGRIVELSTSSDRYATTEGIKVGTPFAEVEKAYGPAPERREAEGLFDFIATWPERGIDFAVRGDSVIHIGVFRPPH